MKDEIREEDLMVTDVAQGVANKVTKVSRQDISRSTNK